MSVRATMFGLEQHLVRLMKTVEEFGPDLVVLDPMSAFTAMGQANDVTSMLLRWIDHLKADGITAFATVLSEGQGDTGLSVSSMIDTWIEARVMESDGESNRVLRVIKSRGSNHSNQLSEFVITPTGLELREPYVGEGQVLTGSARAAQEIADREDVIRLNAEVERRRRLVEARRKEVQAQVSALWAGFEEQSAEWDDLNDQAQALLQRRQADADQRSEHRGR